MKAVLVSAVLVSLLGCSEDVAAPVTAPLPDWHSEHCKNRECYYVMQDEAGADDAVCNGRSPTDLGTMDDQGKRNCPFKSFQSVTILDLMSPFGEDIKNLSRTFFVGEGIYPVWPGGIGLRGDGVNADESVILTNFRGEDVVLEGGNCPASCVVQGPTGPVTLEPCCFIPCPTCMADPACQPVAQSESGCGIPWDKVPRVLTISGSWVRAEGFTMRGCTYDGVDVSWRSEGTPPKLIANDTLILANNVIQGCDVNENIKGYGSGPGPSAGGPTWGPTYIIGNELSEMASQGIDATGVHHWFVEENYMHDAKSGSFMGTTYDGGGIGFKNGGSEARVRNNWLSRGGGIGMGGVSGSCIDATIPPTDWGCFQLYEMTDGHVENNVILDSPIDSFRIYQCDQCRFLGNQVDSIGGSALALLQDDCPGPRCPAHNPSLLPTRDLMFERNFMNAGPLTSDGPYFFVYYADVHPMGPVAQGMQSSDNTFCAPVGLPPSSDPAAQLQRFGHAEPPMLYALNDFASQIGDTGSSVYNAPGASMAACPAAPPSCNVGVSSDRTTVSWTGPEACANCTCSLAWDDDETDVACSGSGPVPAPHGDPGRHYVGLRVRQPGGGASCGASYQVGAPLVGADCSVAVEADRIRWQANGVTCRLVADGSTDLGQVACSGEQALPADLTTPGRHHVRLVVRESALGQTTCGTMYGR